ncbi:MAG: response regulator transcription factor [Saprospiraceae bacterium]|nr:response regulator transcription factor [Saprospiraceae bacterium]
MIKIAIADDEMLFRKGLILILEENPDFKIIIEAGNGAELMERIRLSEEKPDILLLDLQMPVRSGIQTAPDLQKEFPEIRIIIISSHYHRSYIIHLIELGASAYLPKNADPNLVATSIREVHQKGFYYTGEVLSLIREHLQTPIKTKPIIPGQELSSREMEVLQLICEQCTTTEIAEKLFISPRTVDGHRNRLLEKTDSRNTAGLVIYALQNDLVSLNPRI